MNDKHRFVSIIHGFGMTPEKMWFPWMHERLEKHGYGVEIPILPDPLRPTYEKWMRKIKPLAARWDESTVVIGHSIGGVLALRALEHVAKRPVRGVMLIGAPFASYPGVPEMHSGFAMPIDWSRLKKLAGKFTIVHSKDDVLSPHDHALRYQEMLGARLVLTNTGGHFIGKTAPTVWSEFQRLMR